MSFGEMETKVERIIDWLAEMGHDEEAARISGMLDSTPLSGAVNEAMQNTYETASYYAALARQGDL